MSRVRAGGLLAALATALIVVGVVAVGAEPPVEPALVSFAVAAGAGLGGALVTGRGKTALAVVSGVLGGIALLALFFVLALTRSA